MEAERILDRLIDENPQPGNWPLGGDNSMLPNAVAFAPHGNIARTFGEEFRSAVLSLPVGQWSGPVESGFGLHLVKVTRREESRIPDWREVRDRVRPVQPPNHKQLSFGIQPRCYGTHQRR